MSESHELSEHSGFFSKTQLSAVILAISVFFTVLFRNLTGFPYLSLFLAFITLSSLVYLYKPSKSHFTTLIYISILILSNFLILRVNPLLTLLTLAAIMYLGSILIIINKEEKIGIYGLIFSPIFLAIELIGTKNQFTLDIKNLLNFPKKLNSDKIIKYFTSIIITILVLLIVLPLLSYINPIFKNYFAKLFEIITNINITKWIDEILILTITLYFIPKILTVAHYEKFSLSMKLRMSEISSALFLPKAAVAIVLVLFFFTQFELYTASKELLNNLGYSNSSYTREVFAQLGIVALVIYTLLYNNSKHKKINSAVTWILILEGIFLNLMAYKSVWDYTTNWGFTYKRLYGFAGVFWILSAFLLFAYNYYNHNYRKNQLVKGLVILSAVTIILINLANFDKMIYHRNQARTQLGTDYGYLSELSADSDSFEEQLKVSRTDPEAIKNTGALDGIKSKRRSIVNKYQNKFDIKNFNFSDYRAFSEINKSSNNDYPR